MADIIRCDSNPSEFLVWKSPNSNPEFGSQIIVQETQKVILLSSGELVGTLDPGTYPIESPNIPFFKKLLPGGSDSIPYDVWFITTTTSTDYKWGTANPIDVFDKTYQLSLPIGAHGSIRLNINDYQSFFKQIIGTRSLYTPDELRTFVQPYIHRVVSQIISDVASVQQSILEISSQTNTISQKCGEKVILDLNKFGLSADEFFVEGISLISDDPSFVEIKKTLDEAAKTRVQAKADADKIRIKGDAISANMDTYKIDRSFDVLETAAKNEGGAAGSFIGAGLGLGAGMNLGNVMADQQKQNNNLDNNLDFKERLKNIKELLDQGLITNEDYENKKSEILRDI